MKNINSLAELKISIKENEKSYLLLYKEDSEKSICAKEAIESSNNNYDDINFLISEVSSVRDIHPEYSIKTVPTLIEFEKDKVKSIIKGCHNESYYKAIFDEAVYIAKANKEGKAIKRVTVYSTPNCSWCNTLKSYLRKNNIRFNNIDVSKDQKAAEEMTRRSGQRGVPQTDINGEIVVGFDKVKINKLLEIK